MRRTPATLKAAVLATTLIAVVLATALVTPISTAAAHRQVPRPRVGHLAGPRHAVQWGMVETRAVITPEADNPFDPAQIDVQAVFRDPAGREYRVVGFWYQGYRRSLVDGREVLTPRGRPHWRVRFTPPAAGHWRWWWEVRTPDGFTRTRTNPLHVHRRPGRGFVRVSAQDERFLAFGDGSPYFAVGENTGWYDARGTYAYDEWFGALAAQGANFARLWMPSWAFGIEWSDTGLGDYTGRLDRAWQLDRVLATGERLGLYQMIALLNHGAFSTRFNSEWSGNPYNAANGGPLADPSQFFTDAAAKEMFKRRLRYIVARWGYSTHLLAWELWNEVDLIDRYNSAAITAWHAEMAAELRALDPYDHLVTSSHAFFFNDPAVWAGGGLDFTQLHFYSRGEGYEIFPDVAEDVVGWTAARIAGTGKPALFGEIGVDSRGPAETRAADPGGVGIHDGLWAGVVSGGSGTAMTWWWDNLIDLEPDLYYPMFGAVSRFVDGVAWDGEGFAAAAGSAASASRPLVLYGLQGASTALLWVKDDAFGWKTPDPVEVIDGSLTLTGLGPGNWCGRWYDTWAGSWGTAVSLPGGAAVALPVPAFTGDVALRLERCA